MFRRRIPRGWCAALREWVWPRRGWRRAVDYLRHRLRRLPDSPARIARGMAAGVFSIFTPFYGLHFLVALGIAWVIRGNYLAAVVGTFALNPLTVVPISASAMWIGHELLGDPLAPGELAAMGAHFAGAGRDLWNNLLAPFTAARADWGRLAAFWDEVFLPYLVGGLVPGVAAGLLAYAVTVPAARAWQAARRRAIEARLARLARGEAPRPWRVGPRPGLPPPGQGRPPER